MMMYYGMIFYFLSFFCPLSCLLFMSGYLSIMLVLFYQVKSYKLLFFFEELHTLDLLGTNFFIMTWILTFGCLMVISIMNFSSSLFFLMLFLASCSVSVYMSLHMLEFYMNFELSLLPIFFMILGWGYQPERFSAGFALFMYTLAGSIPFLGVLSYLNYFQLSTFFQSSVTSDLINSFYFSIFFFLAFLIKLPMFMFHSWLPKAHVEAPVYGSMFLAGTLLKLGALGLYRIFYMSSYVFNGLVMSLSTIGMTLISFLCFLCIDMKVLIAYSSVVHMGLSLIVFMNLSQLSMNSSMMGFITHGLCSSLMFLMAHMLYSLSNSRSLIINQNLMLVSPLMTSFWFLACMGMMGGPPSSTLLSELMSFSVLSILWEPFMFFLIISAFLGGMFSMLLYIKTSHNPQNYSLTINKPFNFSELIMIKFHLYWLIAYSFIFMWIILMI